jgi:predicted MPP superfamily phosphohydrolase
VLYVFLTIAAAGHAILWVAIVNRLHGTAMRRTWMDLLTFACGLAATVIPLAVLMVHLSQPENAAEEYAARQIAALARWYVILCAAFCLLSAIFRLWTLLHSERRGAILANHTTRFELPPDAVKRFIRPGLPRLLGRLPMNEVLQVQLHEKQLSICELPTELSGLRIAHLSDLHMSGRILKPYFHEVVDRVNAARPDIITITGDIVERQQCVDWVPEILGRLAASAGVYYVLGNHDLKAGLTRLKEVLQKAGIVHVGGRELVVPFPNGSILLAGNELPWLGPPPTHAATDLEGAPRGEFRILLSHSPDQFAWAQEHGYDLVLAGHTHGGQVRIPPFGAIFVPSLHGVRYAAGTFRSKRTVMHVSRGTSSLTPLRFRCPPEIAILRLHPSKR